MPSRGCRAGGAGSGLDERMSARHRPRPWHEVVRLKDELRTGELSLAEFAADLHEVTLQRGQRPVYEEPEKFFALTYPTYALRELVKDVAARLDGKSDKAVRQLELTLRRRQDAHADHAVSPVPGTGGVAGRGGGPRVPRARGRPAAGRSRRGALLRQDRRRTRHRGRAVAGWPDASASPSLERAGLPARRRRRAAFDSRRRQRRGAGNAAGGAAAGQAARTPAGAGPRHADPGRRGPHVREGEGGPGPRVAGPRHRLLPVPGAGGDQGGPGGDGGVAARHRPGPSSGATRARG